MARPEVTDQVFLEDPAFPIDPIHMGFKYIGLNIHRIFWKHGRTPLFLRRHKGKRNYMGLSLNGIVPTSVFGHEMGRERSVSNEN